MLRSLPRLAVVLLVAAALLATPASASALGGSGSSSVLHAIWQPLAGLWNWLTGAPAPQQPRPANGCSIDPLGHCVNAPAPRHPRPASGCSIDPYGHCVY